MGLLIPLPDQIEQARKKYQRLKGEIILKPASPYAMEDEVSMAAEELRKGRSPGHCDALHGIYTSDEAEGDGDYGEANHPCTDFGGEDTQGAIRLMERRCVKRKFQIV